MGRIRKSVPTPHILILDTSTLWFEDKHYPVDPAFDEFLAAYLTPFSLEIRVPEVVRGELLFQQTTSALKCLLRANAEIKNVERVTRRSYSHRVTKDRVKREVEAKLDTWIEGCHAKVIPTPTNTILWPSVVHQAIWRKPPFSFDPKVKDNEKGFRDALILETLVHFVSQDNRKVQIAFLCKDQLLRETAESRLASDGRFSAYELIQDFRTYLDLTKEQLEDKFIKAIMTRASRKFFTKEDRGCLYYKDDVKVHLKEKYATHFDNPGTSEGKPSLRRGLLRRVRGASWDPVESGMFWIGRSQYVERQEDNVYSWRNEINYVRRYEQESARSDDGPQNQILVLTFQITWKSRVTSDGRFMSYEYTTDELSDSRFRPLTDEDIDNWNLE